MEAELRRRGHDTTILAWSDPDSAWESFDALIVRSTWDYHHHLAAFEMWLDQLSTLPIAVFNPPHLMKWNLRKTYLRDLKQQGVCLPKSFFGREIVRSFVEKEPGIDSWVLKPIVGASADGIRLLERGELLQALDRAEIDDSQVFVQEFVPEISTSGEVSLVFIDGQFIRAVKKTPAPGDFRVQEQYGGRFTVIRQIDRRFIEPASALIARLPERPLYARVDGFIRQDSFVLMELELIEPELFLRMVPEVLEAFTVAIERVFSS
ncbi:MAG: hypothetical protein HY716_06350 [Planctomycetes bacterium]|nr:hypothetical protein [Planctomycetota bacterium]